MGVHSVATVERHSKRILILKMVLDNGLSLLRFMLLTEGNRRRKKRIFGMNC